MRTAFIAIGAAVAGSAVAAGVTFAATRPDPAPTPPGFTINTSAAPDAISAGWAAKWCQAQIGWTRAQMRDLMGTPTKEADQSTARASMSWYAKQWGFVVFFDGQGRAAQLDINTVDLSPAERAALTCDVTRGSLSQVSTSRPAAPLDALAPTLTSAGPATVPSAPQRTSASVTQPRPTTSTVSVPRIPVPPTTNPPILLTTYPKASTAAPVPRTSTVTKSCHTRQPDGTYVTCPTP